MKAGLLALGLLTLAASCGFRQPVPVDRAHDARFGYFGGSDVPPRSALCTKWSATVADGDPQAKTHLSYPETNMQSACFTEVVHAGRSVSVGRPPPGCVYPTDPARAQLRALADQLTALAGGTENAASALFPCQLLPEQLTAAALHNAAVLRALAGDGRGYPYAAVILPGHGTPAQEETALSGYLPSDSCRTLRDGDLERLGAMPARAALGADALRGGVAPIAIVSGGAVHSRLVEAFALAHLLECREHLASSRLLVEPCAEHTHTNLRNSARWLEAIGGRVAYLVTDPGIQAEYFQDLTGFELLLGSIDQRSLRDWGYLIGSWRQASVGTNVGFWFTPYRFWAEPRGGLGSLTCVDEN